MMLETANKILGNSTFRRRLEELEILEKERIFCGHGLEHLLAVARMTMLICNERNIAAEADIVYSAALLHDIGRVEEYTQGVPHETAGAEMARQILAEIGCCREKTEKITGLILSHRKGGDKADKLKAAFYEADKKSRMCSFCKAQDECNWSKEKRNYNIEV
ncbi:HD domain-containing protein [Ruminococcus flavefaciens]|uniref:HDIG domain-containing protein n=1 Tax=Ruminococcus flavefaciens TaxID=1265 RepID=A0A1M7LNC5_RUMFL|nr:HD domain-containing protein [Ruminococcus flavefaciens]SHM79117.1 HDIG domain-containing protein [Ruminococcus flavefaciens]